jgi:hypothetical protein
MNGPSYQIVQWTQHYRIVDGRCYRDAIARRSDGSLRLVAVPAPAVAA